MDLLRFLLGLPVRLVRGLLAVIGLLLRPLVGDVHWTAPHWMPAAAAVVRRRPLHFVVGFAAVVVLGLGGWFGWQWYQHRPKPVEPELVSFTAEAPAITDYTAQTITYHPLDVHFSASAAPIALVGKTVSSGIVMQPAIKGEWRWVDDRLLRFQPTEDWPVGQHVEVRFDVPKVFAAHVLMADDHLVFDTAPFEASLGSREFYQDPQQPTAKKVIVQVRFNYPVDPAEFEKRVALTLGQRDDSRGPGLKFSVTYDPSKLNAWVHSQPLDLPRDEGAVLFRLEAGVRSVRGGKGTGEPLETSVRVPGLYSLGVNHIEPTLVDNDKYEPEQVLVLNFNGTVRDSDVAGRVHAWILPARKPDVTQDDDEPPYAWERSDVGQQVLAASTALPLELVPTENEYSALQSFKYHAVPGQRVYVRVDAGLRSFGGYVMGKPYADVFTVPDYPKLLRFMADGALLPLSGDRRVSVVARNLPGMRLMIGRVLPDQLQHLVSLNRGNYTQPSLPSNFSEDHIVERFEQKSAFPTGEPGKAHYEGIDLSPYLKDGRRGVFLLHLAGWDPKAEARKAEAAAKARGEAGQDAQTGDAAMSEAGDEDAGGAEDDVDADNSEDLQVAEDTRLVVVTDLGLIVKRALDGSQDVFVQSIHGGQPVEGASVAVRAINGQVLFSQLTGTDGTVHFPTFKGLERDKKPALYVVQKGDDLSFLPVGAYDRQLDFSRFDIGGERNAVNQGQLTGYLFSDRGIYRPGDTFHIGLIVRAASWARSVAGIPLQAEIVDPRGDTAKRVPLTMDASGFGELAYAPEETAPTGAWTVNLYIVKDGQPGAQIGSTTVQVKEFLPDRMKVEAKLSPQVAEGWVKPDQLKALVDAQNLFGTPAADRRVEGTLTLRPAWPAFQHWPDFHFYDVRRAKEGYEEKLEDARTDAKGHAEFALDLKKYADATYQLYFMAKVYEAEGGRSVATAAQTLVSANDWLVGYKAADSLDYVSRGATRAVRLVAVDPRAQSIELKGLRAQLVERRYVSVLTKQDSGVYKYESKLKEVPVDERPLTIASGGMDYPLPTDKPGDYALVIRRADGTEVNRVEYSVAGAANVARSLDRNAELQLHLDKHDYAPGERIAIDVRAPYTGSGLITLERDKVYAHAWFHADTTASVQYITVPEGFEGNGYVNVQFVRDPSSDEIFMSPLSYGVVPFSVNVDARRNAITVDAPAQVKPGETVTFKLHADKPTRAVVFAVDEGILQVARYKLGDPLAFFFRKRMLEVGTAQILDLVLPDFAKLMAMAAPGGDADAAIGRQLNPFKRKRDKPVTYWSGIVDVDGEKDLAYTVPDYFNGRLRVMAVAVSPQQIGTYEGATTVRGDFVLSPNVPTTLAPGDEAEVSVGVANNLTGLGGKTVPVSVKLATGPQLQVLGAAAQTLTLGELREGVVRFRVKATDTLGSGNLTFVAGYGGKSARQSVDLSVRPASPYRVQLDLGRIDAGGKTDLPDLRKLYDAYASREAAISTLPVVLMQGLGSYLVNFQNYCSEQVVSMAVPQLVLARWPQVPAFQRALQPAFADQAASKPGSDAGLGHSLDALRTRQNAQGGFGLWTATPDSEPFVSAYAVHFLLEARERGMSVPADMLDAGNRYLHQLAANDDVDSLDGLRQRAYAVYLLTRQGNVTTNDLAAVQKRLQEAYPKDWQDDLAAAWLAASYQLLKQDGEAARLIAGPEKQLRRSTLGDYSYGYYYDPSIRDASVLYLLAKHFPERVKTLPPQALENIVQPLANGWYNTLSSAMTLLALDAYAGDNATELDKLAIAAVHADGTATPIGQTQGNLLLSGTWDAHAARLRFANASAHAAWWMASQGGYDRGAPAKAIAQGIEIVREYTDTEGKPLDHAVSGEEIDVHVKIRATGSDGVGNVAIVDLLPGGFEPVIEPPPAASSPQDADQPQEDDAQPQGDDAAAAATAWRSPIGLSESSWEPEYADVREDRVVIYGTATPDVREFVYRIKATNAGRYIVPPAYGESLYDRRVQARSAGGGTLTVTDPP